MYNFKFSAFADEASKNLAEQIDALRANGIGLLEMRGVNGQNVADLDVATARAVRRDLDAADIAVWSLGSPIGKIKLADPFAPELDRFKRLLETADITGATRIRLFSFYEAEGDGAFDAVCERLDRFVEAAQGSGVVLCHENEKGIYGDIASRCLAIHQALPALRAVYDPANFVQCKQDTAEAWEMLAPYVDYMHIKDARWSDGVVVPPGKGDGQLAYLLKQYAAQGGEVLTLEPHLKVFKGLEALEGGERPKVPDGMFATGREAFDFAVASLRGVIEGLA
ncbi:MAG: sugar phosphate isomerase/epimerase [Clostridia bacterium]|nr:sugar phosphate isomerase/epimerase [Clostridia bacterium]